MLNLVSPILHEIDFDPSEDLLDTCPFAPTEYEDVSVNDFTPSLIGKSSVDENLRDLALTMIVYAARDVRAFNRRKVGGKTDRKLTRVAKEATTWLTNPSEGFLPFGLCCRILFGEQVDPRRAGKRIAENPDQVASMMLPKSEIEPMPVATTTAIQDMVHNGLIAMH